MAAADTALTAGPAGERIVALDALRGLAVLGIAVMNVVAFAMPAAAYVNPRAFGLEGSADVLAWAFGFVLVEDKFRTLFAMMFGAGVAILLDKRGAHPLRGHCARMGVLFAIGFLHALLLASNDVLRVYALAGLVLPLVLRWQGRQLVTAAIVLVAGQLAVSGYFALQWLAAAGDPATQAAAEASYGAVPQVIAEALERGDEGMTERIDRRLAELLPQARFILAGLPSALAAMLLGVAGWRSGLLAGRWEPKRALRLALWCALVALPVLAGLAVWSWRSNFDPIVAPANALVWSAPFDLLLGAGYAALAMAVFVPASGRGWLPRLSAVGRMALTNYLASSLVFSLVFASWGLGLFGELSRWQAVLVSLVPIALVLAWSEPWLARFRQGPAEWLWRSLARLQALPFRR